MQRSKSSGVAHAGPNDAFALGCWHNSSPVQRCSLIVGFGSKERDLTLLLW